MIEAHAETAVAQPSVRWGMVDELRFRHSTSLGVLLSFILVIAGYVTAQYVLLPGNSPYFFPFIYDDYLVLTYGLPTDLLRQTRPIYLLLAAIVTSRGIDSFYPVLAGFSALNAWLVLRFVFWICRRPLPLVWSFIFGLFVFSASIYIWAGKYNLLTNHLSMLFAVLAMFALVAGATRSSTMLSLVGIGLFALSIFAKEDYFLAILCVSAYCLLKGGLTAWRRNSVVLLSLLFVVVVFLWHTRYIAPFSHVKFAADASDPYAQRLSISSMVSTFVTYLGSYSLPTTFLLALFGVAVLYATLIARRLEYYLILAIIVATVIPYTLLPNHVTGYNAINWIPWMVAFLLVLLPLSLPSPREIVPWIGENRQRITGDMRQSSRAASPAMPEASACAQKVAPWQFPGLGGALGNVGLALLLALVAAVTLVQTQEGRAGELAYFVKQSDINRTMVDDLLAHQEQLAAVDTVGIVGVDRWSPWLKTQAEFLTELGFDNRWLVFVPRLDFYHVQQAIDPYDPTTATLYYTGPVTYLRLADLEQYPDVPLLVFDDDGHVVSWGTPAGDYFHKCVDRSGEGIAKKCRTNTDA